LLDLDDAESFRVFARVSTFADEKRRLVFFLLDHASLTEGDPVTLEVLTKVATDEPFDADHIVTTLIESQPGDVITYDLVWSYIDQDDLRNRSWDDFLGSYGLDGVIQGRIDARCLLSPVEPPRELEEVIQEMRLCFAFGQLTAVHACVARFSKLRSPTFVYASAIFQRKNSTASFSSRTTPQLGGFRRSRPLGARTVKRPFVSTRVHPKLSMAQTNRKGLAKWRRELFDLSNVYTEDMRIDFEHRPNNTVRVNCCPQSDWTVCVSFAPSGVHLSH